MAHQINQDKAHLMSLSHMRAKASPLLKAEHSHSISLPQHAATPPIPHYHEEVDLSHTMTESRHDPCDIMKAMADILHNRQKYLTSDQRSLLRDYQWRNGDCALLTDPTVALDDKALVYGHLINVLIFQKQLTGRVTFVFKSKYNFQQPAETKVEHGYATITIWNQDYYGDYKTRLRKYVDLMLAQMRNAFMMIFGCAGCYSVQPNYSDEHPYHHDMYFAIMEAARDPGYLNLDMKERVEWSCGSRMR